MISVDWSAAVAALRCPLCEGQLSAADGVLRCERGHAFDIAKDGYVNLLAPGRAAPRLAGDSKEMLRARRDFLDRGHYQPLSDAINVVVARHLARPDRRIASVEAGGSGRQAGAAGLAPTGSAAEIGALAVAEQATPLQSLAGSPPVGILDAGCGEGYYLGQLGARLAAQAGDGMPLLFGMDIAREAARMAASRYLAARFVVADVNARWPFADASMALMLNIFAPRNPIEFARVLAPGGLLLVALPASAHLAELRRIVPLLTIEPDKRERVIERLDGSFALTSAASLEYPLELSGADAALLVRMTPSARHMAPEALAGLATRERVCVTASFSLLAFAKRGDEARRGDPASGLPARSDSDKLPSDLTGVV